MVCSTISAAGAISSIASKICNISLVVIIGKICVLDADGPFCAVGTHRIANPCALAKKEHWSEPRIAKGRSNEYAVRIVISRYIVLAEAADDGCAENGY